MISANKSRSPATPWLRPVVAAVLAIGASHAMAASVTLCAEPYQQAVPGLSGTVPMWGYRQVTAAADCDTNAGVGTSSPGPLLTIAPGDTTLAVTLVNKLTVPTSIVIAGQVLAADGGAPVSAVDLVGPSCDPTTGAVADRLACRVRSFTGETQPGAARTYTFNNLKPGTYLYQSGTHPQVQVQMGLFGMSRQDATVVGSTGRLLFANAAAGFDVDVPVVLSEIDPDQHVRIAQTLGSADPTTWKSGGNSTLNYAPRFFLINGKVFDETNPTANDLIASNAGNGARVVLRIANAGLQSRSLMLNTGTWKLLTEDGNPYVAAREQATALVPAGKTTDALIISSAPTDGSTSRELALFDRRGGTDNADGRAMGGQIARLAQSGPAVPFIAAIANQVANEGSAFALQVQGANITTYGLTGPAGMTISAGGLISWPVPTGTPAPTVASVTVTGADGVNAPASQSFTVRINHTPTIAATGPVAVAHGSVTVAAPGVLAGAADIDGDALSAVQTAAASAGTLTLNVNGSYTWSGPQPATGTSPVTFSVASRDPGGLQSAPTTVTLNVAANVPPVAGSDAYTITLARFLGVALPVNNATQVTALTRNIATTLLGNDADVDGGTINAQSISAVVPVPPLASGTISARRINPNSPVGCTTDCATITQNALQSPASVSFNTTNGTFIVLPHRGILTQIPVAGTYEFRYTVRDEQSGQSNQAVVRVTVN